MIEKILLGPAATGTPTSGAYKAEGDFVTAALQFEVEAVGATPTLTYVWEGSLDGVNFKPINYITDATDTPAVTARTVTAVGVEILFLSLAQVRRYKYFRVRVTANTNVTFNAKMQLDEN